MRAKIWDNLKHENVPSNDSQVLSAVQMLAENFEQNHEMNQFDLDSILSDTYKKGRVSSNFLYLFECKFSAYYMCKCTCVFTILENFYFCSDKKKYTKSCLFKIKLNKSENSLVQCKLKYNFMILDNQ